MGEPGTSASTALNALATSDSSVICRRFWSQKHFSTDHAIPLWLGQHLPAIAISMPQFLLMFNNRPETGLDCQERCWPDQYDQIMFLAGPGQDAIKSGQSLDCTILLTGEHNAILTIQHKPFSSSKGAAIHLTSHKQTQEAQRAAQNMALWQAHALSAHVSSWPWLLSSL